MPTVEIEVGLVGVKRFWSLVPNGGPVTGDVFQRPGVRVNFCGERIAGALVVLERRRPRFWHGGRGGGGAR